MTREVGPARLPWTQRGRRIPSTQRHRRHDELVSELGLWYTRPVPEMGFYVQERRFGFYQRQKDTGRVRATVRHLPAEDVPRSLQDLRDYCGEDEITFHVDDRELDEHIGPVLLQRGCTLAVAEVFLAHPAGMPILASESENLSVEAVNGYNFEEAMRTERKGFAGSEAEPDAEELRRRLILRRAEMGGQGRFLLARVAGEAASVLAFYEGEDRFVHHLATRLPFRRRGIARRLFLEVLAGARTRLQLDHHKRSRTRAPGRSLPLLGLHRRALLAQGIQARPWQGAYSSSLSALSHPPSPSASFIAIHDLSHCCATILLVARWPTS